VVCNDKIFVMYSDLGLSIVSFGITAALMVPFIGFLYRMKFTRKEETQEVRKTATAAFYKIREMHAGKVGVPTGGEKSGMACSTNSECRSSGAEISFAGRCQMFDGTTGRYGLTSSAACGLDCRTPGPYCGDGIVQAEFGEECDGDIQCSVSGLPGSQQCSSSCAIIEQQARAWWKFDDLVVFSVGGKQVGRATEEQGPLLTSAYGGSTLCTIDTSIPSTCPTFVSGGKYGGALQFNGVDSQLHMELQQTSSTQVTYLNHS
jgi:hypothetical protein